METINILDLELNKLNALGLDKNKSKELAKKLNVLLASYSVFYQNARGYHWNLKGEKFFELHLKFEELYASLYLKIDEIAERILTIGFPANHNFSAYKTTSKINESIQVSNGLIAVEDILASLKTIISLQRDILIYSNQIDDEGTHAIMSNNIQQQEKLVWMYTKFLEK
ncbi:MAG: ferritin-like domain-containing protein [Bacteroidota bacterium]|nr:ferritin-like domain-containing protein [Bacteroidota bacterium]